MYSIWSPHTQSRPPCDKDLTLIRINLTDDKIDCALKKDYSNENLKYYLNTVILAQLNINSIRNKFNLLGEGIKGKVDVLMISETKIDKTFPPRQFYIEGFTPPYRLDIKFMGVVFLYMSERILCLS